MEPITQAVILAAGKGSRLKPITDTIPKALVEVNGTPMLEILVRQLTQRKICDIVMVVHYKQDQIRNYFGDGRDFGAHINYAVQAQMMGSADAVLCAEPYINSGRFITLACDSLFEPEHLDKLLSNPSPGVLTTKIVEDPRRYGIVVSDGDRVGKIVEKPDTDIGNLANGSVYVFPQSIFNACRGVEKNEKSGEFYLTDAINALIASGVEFRHETCRHMIDIGTHEQLQEANELAAKILPAYAWKRSGPYEKSAGGSISVPSKN